MNFVDPFGFAPGDKYKSPDEAANHAIEDVNSTSIKEGREYAGRIYQNSDGTYSYTAPNKGTKSGSCPGETPADKKNEGYYHTHGSDDPGYDNENFSPEDKNFANNEGKPGYVGTPSGKTKKYDPPKK